MARPLRLEFENALYHVTARGNGRKNIFVGDRDKAAFVELLSQVCVRYNLLCFAFCLMDNHYHLVIETPQGNLSKAMRQLNGTWAQRFNRHHKGVGHLFQSRFLAHLIEKDVYLLEVLRYIALNPIRAKMCQKPQDYEFSSYRQTAGFDGVGRLAAVDWVLSQFASTRPKAIQAYRQFVLDGIGKRSVFDDAKGGIFLGSEDFVIKHTLLLADEKLSEIPKVQRPEARPSMDQVFAHKSRTKRVLAEGSYRAYVDWGYSMKEIADYLNVHYATVSRAIKRYEKDHAAG